MSSSSRSPPQEDQVRLQGLQASPQVPDASRPHQGARVEVRGGGDPKGPGGGRLRQVQALEAHHGHAGRQGSPQGGPPRQEEGEQQGVERRPLRAQLHPGGKQGDEPVRPAQDVKDQDHGQGVEPEGQGDGSQQDQPGGEGPRQEPFQKSPGGVGAHQGHGQVHGEGGGHAQGQEDPTEPPQQVGPHQGVDPQDRRQKEHPAAASHPFTPSCGFAPYLLSGTSIEEGRPFLRERGIR